PVFGKFGAETRGSRWGSGPARRPLRYTGQCGRQPAVLIGQLVDAVGDRIAPTEVDRDRVGARWLDRQVSLVQARAEAANLLGEQPVGQQGLDVAYGSDGSFVVRPIVVDISLRRQQTLLFVVTQRPCRRACAAR